MLSAPECRATLRENDLHVTLVVGRVTPLGVRVSADMRITTEGKSGGFARAALKPILIRPTLCIAYAGVVVDAVTAIRDVAAAGLDAGDAEAHLLAAHNRSRAKRGDEQAAEFLVASLNPARLAVIKNGTAGVREDGWLGDSIAFNEYWRHYNADRPVPWDKMVEGMPDAAARAGDFEIADRMGVGMHAVVDGPSMEFDDEGKVVGVLLPRGGSHPLVGEAIVTAAPRNPDNLFGYLTYVSAHAPPFAQPLPAVNGVSPADFGTTERGSFSCNLLTPIERGVGAMGLYFAEGRLGVLYAPLQLDEPELYPKVDRASFVELVRLKREISLEGLGAAYRDGSRDPS